MSEPRMYPGGSRDEVTDFAPYSAFDIPADLRELHGRWDVDATAARVRNYRYAEEWTMMILGGWMATVPEVPVKTGLGKIVWDGAQAADILGRRLPELRGGRRSITSSAVANQGFADFIQAVAEPERPDLTIEKLTGVFDVLKPHLLDVYAVNMRETDQIADAPTIELLEDISRRTHKHVAWGDEVLVNLCDDDAKKDRRSKRAAELQEALTQSGGVTGDLSGLPTHH